MARKFSKSMLEKVRSALQWKKSAKRNAKRLGIPIEEYDYYRDIIREEVDSNRKNNEKRRLEGVAATSYDSGYNLEKGEGRLSKIVEHEPKTPEEIIKILKIDTTKWKLSAYWNKQMGNNYWRVSAMITQIKDKEDVYFQKLIDNWKPKTYKSFPTIKQDKKKIKVCGILSLQDIHFGKGGNHTIDKDFEETIHGLLTRAINTHYLSNIFFVLGGDLINMDTFDGATTKGTPVENSCTATEAYIQAFDAMCWGINYIKTFCDVLTVVYIPGNHDRLSSFHLAHALSKAISTKNIEWDVEYAERKVHTWYNNFNAFEHGDVPSKNTPLIYATDFADDWGKAENRTLFTGHKHTQQKIEYMTKGEKVGFVHKTLPSLSKTDYWHYHRKFVGNRRGGLMELQDPIKGTICELTHLIN